MSYSSDMSRHQEQLGEEPSKREYGRHSQEEESKMVAQIQSLYAKGENARADDLLVSLLDMYADRVERVSSFVGEKTNVDIEDAWFATRAVFAYLIKVYKSGESGARLDQFLGRPKVVVNQVIQYMAEGRGLRQYNPSLVSRAETNRPDVLAELIDVHSDSLNDPELRRVNINRLGYLVQRIAEGLTTKQRSVLFAYFGFGDQEAKTLEAVGEEHGVTYQDIHSTLKVIYKHIKDLYVLAERGEKWPSDSEVKKYEDAIITRLEIALRQLPEKSIKYAWRYYNLDGYGRLNSKELQEFGNVGYFLKVVREIVLEALHKDPFVTDALDKLGLTKMGANDLLFAFGDELRERLKGSN